MSIISSSPSNPASVTRQIGPLHLRIDSTGLTVHRSGERLHFDVEEALSLSDFLRGPGARALIARLWLSEQHAAEVAESS